LTFATARISTSGGASQQVSPDHGPVEALNPHRRAIALSAVLRDQLGDLRAGAGRNGERIGIVDVQHLKLRACVTDPGQQPLDLGSVPIHIGKEACLLAEPEVPNSGRIQRVDLVDDVARVSEADTAAFDWLVAEGAELAPSAAPIQLDLRDRPPA
jgi:hypothetical protein